MKTQNFKYLGDFIDGKFLPSVKSDGEIKDLSPSDLNDAIGVFPFSRDRADDACAAAKKAYPGWMELSMEDRKNYLLKLKSCFDRMADEMAEIISRDAGKPLWEALIEAKALGQKIDITIELAEKMIADEKIINALPEVDGVIRYRSRGVMCVLGPFNFPAHLPNGHIIPALLAGNTVVFKPSEHTPAVGQFYAQAFERADFPPGVFNLIQGDGETGRKLVVSDLVDGILFTGSYEVGLRIKQETLNHYWKILALEMGGKNSTIIWEDADLDKAVYETLVGSFLTAGQRCACTSRILVHEKVADKFTDRFYEAAKKLSIGHWSENPFMGPLINSAAVEKYIRFQEIANRENCESMMRGKLLELKHKGFYVTPSIHIVNKYDPKSVYLKSEIFGPNVSIMKINDLDQAINTINSSGYGLVMALFTKNEKLYRRALQLARVGLLNWNRTTNGASSKMPFGGMGKSGNDRPSGSFALNYCVVPVSSLEDKTSFDPNKMMPGIKLS